MPAITGVLFDVDDTLVDTAAAFGAALTESFAEVTDLGPDDADRILSTWRADAGGHYRAYVAGRLTSSQQRQRRVEELTDLLGLERLDDDAFAAWDEAYLARFRAAWTSFDDARSCVEQAVADGLAVGVVTNAHTELQRAKLAAVGLDDLLSSMVAIDTLGVGKPEPEIFRKGAELLGTEPDETIYVGDELDTDAVAACAAGLCGVWLDRPGRRRGGPHTITPQRLAHARDLGVSTITSLTQLPPLWASSTT